MELRKDQIESEKIYRYISIRENTHYGAARSKETETQQRNKKRNENSVQVRKEPSAERQELGSKA